MRLIVKVGFSSGNGSRGVNESHYGHAMDRKETQLVRCSSMMFWVPSSMLNPMVLGNKPNSSFENTNLKFDFG